MCEEESQEIFERTVGFWRQWLSKCQYFGRWRDIVQRSALTLKLLTFQPTGAIVAAPTCSLPEFIGGPRNWDYRYTWIRDAAFSIYALLRLGFTSEASDFMGWLDARYRESKHGRPTPGPVPHRRRTRRFRNAPRSSGRLHGLAPVRVGNKAHQQLQLDIYGELIDSVYLYNKYGSPISHEAWTHLRSHLDWLCENWRQPDDGIWEVRGGRHEFVYSKLMCWVAMDRGLRLADKRSFPANRSRWLAVRDEMYEEIVTRGWSEKRQSFVQSLDGDYLDASSSSCRSFSSWPRTTPRCSAPSKRSSAPLPARPHLRRARPSLQCRAFPRWNRRRRGDVQYVQFLARRGPHAGRPGRSRAARPGAAAL